jgi:hypothetical protein
MVTAQGLARGLAAERETLAGRLRHRARPEEDIARRVAALRLVHAAEVALYGFPDLAEQLRVAKPCLPQRN